MEAGAVPTSGGTTETQSTGTPTTVESPQSVTPDQRPTMAEAFAKDAAPKTPEAQTPPDAPTTQAVEPSADPSALHPSTDKQGPIPFAVHKTALDNARTKGGEEAVAKYREQYGWAERVPRETIQEWSGIAQLMASDPPAFLEKYFAETAAHPTHGQAVRSWAAKTLASRAPKAVDLSPDVIVQDANGHEAARTFSADRVQQIVQHMVSEALGKEVAPLKADLEQRKTAEQRQAAEQKAAETAKQVEAAVDDQLSDAEEVLEITKDTPAEQRLALFAKVNALMDADASLSIHKAAMRVRKSEIVPRLEGNAQKKVLDDLNKKAAANGINPAGAVVAPTHRPRSLNDPSLKW